MSGVLDLVVNRRSKRKYDEFVSAVNQAWIVLEDIRKVIEKADIGDRPRASRVRGKDELLELQARAEKSLDVLESKARRYQAELVSFEWRL